MKKVDLSSITVNGKPIESIADLPPEVRELVDKNQDGQLDSIGELIANAKNAKPTVFSQNFDPIQIGLSGKNPLVQLYQVFQLVVWGLVIVYLVKTLFPEVWQTALAWLGKL
jgi:hypothetical protein